MAPKTSPVEAHPHARSTIALDVVAPHAGTADRVDERAGRSIAMLKSRTSATYGDPETLTHSSDASTAGSSSVSPWTSVARTTSDAFGRLSATRSIAGIGRRREPVHREPEPGGGTDLGLERIDAPSGSARPGPAQEVDVSADRSGLESQPVAQPPEAEDFVAVGIGWPRHSCWPTTSSPGPSRTRPRLQHSALVNDESATRS